MPVPTVDPKVSIKDLIKANWNSANVAGTTTPDFHTGWWNPKSLSAQVTFSGKSESFQGETGYGGISASGPVQVAIGVLFANCWAYRDEGGASPNPKQLTYDMAEEVRRIVLAGFESVTNLVYISVLSIDEVPPEQGSDPMVFRTAVTLGFNWRTT